ncbi:MAG: hypothetical protein OXC05_00265 [Halieaceae bacterium]|nr:hypothetical protein [Halieaceae bacterium]
MQIELPELNYKPTSFLPSGTRAFVSAMGLFYYWLMKGPHPYGTGRYCVSISHPAVAGFWLDATNGISNRLPELQQMAPCPGSSGTNPGMEFGPNGPS